METSLMDPAMVEQAKQMSGEYRGMNIPFIPIIKINNKSIEEQDASGATVTKPPKKVFTLTTKDADKYIDAEFGDSLEGVILKVRYQIESKWKVDPAYRSYEFDFFTEIIPVYIRDNKEEYMRGTYKEHKENFKTGERNGRPETSFELYVILYIEINDEVYRFKIKGKSRNDFFTYKNTFGDNETHVGMNTKINLEWSSEGQIKFWYTTFERGEAVDLSQKLAKLKEIQAYFGTVKDVTEGNEPLKSQPQEAEVVDPVAGALPAKAPEEEEISIDSIPF